MSSMHSLYTLNSDVMKRLRDGVDNTVANYAKVPGSIPNTDVY